MRLYCLLSMLCYIVIAGNHEVRWQNEGMGVHGFKHACNELLGKSEGGKMFERIHCAFDWLPLGAVVGGKILVVHGGIGDGDWDLADLEE